MTVELVLIALSLAAIGIYILPAWIAQAKQHPQERAITVCTILLGWMFVPWVLCLAWAVWNYRMVHNDH